MKRTILACAPALLFSVLLTQGAAAQALRGSPASVTRIYRQAQTHDLHFYSTPNGIHRAGDRGEFVKLTPNANYTLSNVSYPFVLPETHTFVQRLAVQYRAACGEKMVVTSAVRPTSMKLANSNDRSVHPTGMAVDLRKPRNGRCLSWLRNTLVALEASGVLDAVEEHHPPHFHVAVFPSQYSSYVTRRTDGSTQLAANTSRSSGSDGKYKVRQGDSLWTIARRNNVSVESLKAANALSSSRILAGQVLVIPAR